MTEKADYLSKREPFYCKKDQQICPFARNNLSLEEQFQICKNLPKCKDCLQLENVSRFLNEEVYSYPLTTGGFCRQGDCQLP